MQALEMALQIPTKGYNVYLSGEPDLGRSHMLLSYLVPQARKAPTPDDLVYVHNFADPDRPGLFALPAGMGKKFKQSLKDLVEHIREELPRRFEAGAYVKRRAKLVDNFQNARMKTKADRDIMDSLFSQVHSELERVIIKGVEDGSIVKMDSKAAVQVIISLMVGSNRTRVLTPYAVPTLYEEVLDFISRAIKA